MVLTIIENARYYNQTGFRGNSCILLQHFFIQKPCNIDFESCCNCNYILFTKLPWPEDSDGTFRSCWL